MPSVTAYRYEIPLSEPFRIAIGTVTRARNLLVVARRDDGVGFGEASPFPVVTGEDAEETAQGLAAWLAASSSAYDGHRPDPRLGLAGGLAVEAAHVDLAAREAGVPLCTHLSGAKPHAVATSITIPLMAPDAAEACAKRHVAAGFAAFKVKAGGRIDEDLQRITRVREVVGAAEIRVDANQGWSRGEALEVIPSLVDLGVTVLEQPLHRDDLAGHAGLRGHGVPIMLDESVFSVADAHHALAAGACDRINIKLQKTGSIRAALAIAARAAEAGVPCMVGCMIESRVGILAGAHLAAAHDNVLWADLDGHTFLAADPVQGGAAIEAGSIRLGPAPGLGVRHVEAGVPVAPLAA